MSDDPTLDAVRAIEEARDTPFADALARLDAGDGADLLVTVTEDEQRASFEVRKDLGDEVTVGVGGLWQRTKTSAGSWAAWAGLTWRPK